MNEIYIIQNFCKTNLQKLYLYTTEYYEVIEELSPLQIKHINDIFYCNISHTYKICIHCIDNPTKKQFINKHYSLNKKIINFSLFCVNMLELVFNENKSFLLQFISSGNKNKDSLSLFSDDESLNIQEYKFINKIHNIHRCIHCNQYISYKAIKYKCRHKQFHYIHISCKQAHDNDCFRYNHYITKKVCNCNKVASIIQRQFRKSIAIPDYTLCRHRLKREFNELNEVI